MNQTCCNNEKTRSELLDEIRQINFYVIELSLYLDTHQFVFIMRMLINLERLLTNINQCMVR